MSAPAGCQRWTLGRDTYRRPAEPIRPSEYEVADVGAAEAKRFVLDHHYSGAFPAARWRHGLFRGGRLVGVAVWSQPFNPRVLARVFRQADPAQLCELGRFVLLDEVPANGETWLLGRCFELLRREGVRGVVSHSDPQARTAASGRVVFPGHVGTIYQAHNAVYLGRGTPRTLHLLPSGAVLSEEAIGKVRLRKQGWRYAVRSLVAAGAPEPGDDLRGWLRALMGTLTRRFRHRGCHRYAWALDRRLRPALPAGQPYPKKAG